MTKEIKDKVKSKNSAAFQNDHEVLAYFARKKEVIEREATDLGITVKEFLNMLEDG